MNATPTLAAKVAAIPDLTREARQRLADLAADGVQIYTYDTAGGRLVLWIRQYAGEYESRWTIPAWNAYVAGRHLTDLETPCQCRACQERRWECARLRHAIAEGEKLLAKDDLPAKMRAGLPPILAHMRAHLARLEAAAQAEGGAA